MNFKFQKLNILIISPEPWSHIFVSKHHYAIHLAKKGNNIYFLNPPSTKFVRESTEITNVFSIQYKGFIKGLRFLPSIIQQYLIKKKFESIQALCRVKFDIVWSFDNSVFYDFSALPGDVLKISHIVDLNQNFQLEFAAKTASICFCTTDLIKKRLEAYSSRVFKITHGFNLTYDNKVLAIPGRNSIKAGLVGNLAMRYMDWEVLYNAATENVNVDFVFYGPNAENFSLQVNDHHTYKKKLFLLENTYFPGRISSSEIPSVLKMVDVLLISYKEEHHIDQANPHKMMEYLGSGKTIVCSYTEEYVDKKHLLLMTDNNKAFPSLFKYAILNLEELDGVERQSERISFALDNTYDIQLERIEKLIAENVVK